MSLTNEDLSAIATIVKDSISGIEKDISDIKARLDGHDERFISIDQRFEKIDQRFEKIDQRFEKIDQRFDSMDQQFEKIDQRFEKVESDITYIKVTQLENNVIPRLGTIESCYVDTYERYRTNSEKFDAAITDIDVMKLAIQKNSKDIQKLKKMKRA